MKSAAEYPTNHVFEARRPRRELQPVVACADAVQAVEQALADAEKYRYLLMRALRRHDNAVAAVRPTVTHFADTTPVLPLYPGQERMAA